MHSCVAFGRSLGWQGVESRWHADNVQVWVGVMGTGAYHPRHVHKGSVVRRPWSRAIACCARVASPIDPSIVVGLQLSGAYYVNAPPGSGDIVFHDPRGALPPFEHTLSIPHKSATWLYSRRGWCMRCCPMRWRGSGRRRGPSVWRCRSTCVGSGRTRVTSPLRSLPRRFVLRGQLTAPSLFTRERYKGDGAQTQRCTTTILSALTHTRGTR